MADGLILIQITTDGGEELDRQRWPAVPRVGDMVMLGNGDRGEVWRVTWASDGHTGLSYVRLSLGDIVHKT